MKRVAFFGHGQFGKAIESLFPQYEMKCTAIVRRNEELKLLNPDDFDLCIDVALCEGIEERIFWAIDHKKPLIICTTGWESRRNQIISYANKKNSSLIWSSNYALGVWIFKNIIKRAVEYTNVFPEYELGLFEAHHSKKKDAPSGTLLSIQSDIETILNGNVQFSNCFEKKREEDKKMVSIATLRTGSIPGTHSLLIDGPEETIEIIHTSRSRTNFAHGVCTAVRFLEKYPGVWEFSELLQKEFLSKNI